MPNNKHTITLDKMSQRFMVWLTGVTNRLRVLGKAIRYGLVAGEAISLVDYRQREIVFSALHQGEDPQAYQYNVAYAKSRGDEGFFDDMCAALLDLGYTVEPPRLVLFRRLKAPIDLSRKSGGGEGGV
jgi:hypothetical protein